MKKQIITLMILSVALLSGTAEKVNAQSDPLHVKYWNGTQFVIDSLKLGVRPIGAWKEPFQFFMYSDGPTFTVDVLDFTPSDGSFYANDNDVPFDVTNGTETELFLTTNGTTAGVIERQFVAITENSRAAHIWPIVVELYQPSSPDVYELARDLGTLGNNYSLQATEPQTGTTTASLHNDYTLPFPEIPEGNDVVYKFTVDTNMILNASVSQGENGKVALYTQNFNGEGGPKADNNYTGLSFQNCNGSINNGQAGSDIENLPIPAGTYYLVASSTSANFTVSINANVLPCPDTAKALSPLDSATNINEINAELSWELGPYTKQACLLFGTDTNHLDTLVNWNSNLECHYTSNETLNLSTTYFWQVGVRNDNCPNGVFSPIWRFYTTYELTAPKKLVVSDGTVFDDETIVLNWKAVDPDIFKTYYIYRNGALIGNTNDTTYTDGPLAYNMNGYDYYVTAKYEIGESNPSNMVNVRVSGYGDVNGHVYEEDGQTGIANATVTLSGQDEFGSGHTYNFTTNVQGYYSGQIYSGSYNGSANKQNYVTSNEPVQGNPVSIQYNETTSPIDFILELKRFTITYMDGETELNVDTFFFQQPITDYTLSREGWNFDGWNPAVPSLMPAESLTVYAQWTRICDSVTDVDGNQYPTVGIGNLCWMSANMRATHFSDGRDISNVYEYASTMYPNITENLAIYGRLYDWYDAVDAGNQTRAINVQGICPAGWRLPTEEDFAILDSMFLPNLRSTNYWVVNNGNNSTGLDLRPSGMYDFDAAKYQDLLCNAYLWSATATSASEAHCRMATYYCDTLINLVCNKQNAYSVRCVKD